MNSGWKLKKKNLEKQPPLDLHHLHLIVGSSTADKIQIVCDFSAIFWSSDAFEAALALEEKILPQIRTIRQIFTFSLPSVSPEFCIVGVQIFFFMNFSILITLYLTVAQEVELVFQRPKVGSSGPTPSQSDVVSLGKTLNLHCLVRMWVDVSWWSEGVPSSSLEKE